MMGLVFCAIPPHTPAYDEWATVRPGGDKFPYRLAMSPHSGDSQKR